MKHYNCSDVSLIDSWLTEWLSADIYACMYTCMYLLSFDYYKSSSEGGAVSSKHTKFHLWEGVNTDKFTAGTWREKLQVFTFTVTDCTCKGLISSITSLLDSGASNTTCFSDLTRVCNCGSAGNYKTCFVSSHLQAMHVCSTMFHKKARK